MKKRLVSLLLFFVLILQNVPVQVLADHRSVVTPIVLGDFSVAGVGTNRLVSGTTLLSQNTLMAVPYPGAELTLTVKDGYQVRVHSGNNANRIDQTSAWLGADNDGTDTYTYSLPTASIYMRVSLRRSDGAAMTQADLSLSGLTMTYESTSDIVADNAHTAQILSDTDLPVLLHISDIHGDTIRAGRAAQFASAVHADALLASGDLTAYDPDDWGSALFDTMAQYPDVNFVYGIGNHDAKIAASTYQETIYNSYFSHNSATPYGKTYYYKDLPDQKLRLISVNQQEGASTTTSGGTCYSQAQVDWLVETLKSTPAGYGVVLMYHSPETTIAAAGDPNYSEFFQTGNRYDNPTNSYSGYSGTFLMDLIDAFMLRKNFSWNYSEKNGASPVTLNADFTGVAEGVEFIAHLTGHVHSDSITYLPGTACKQLLLGVTCTTSMYGEEGGYYGLADYSDLVRQADTANQDAFNAYIIDRENKTVRVLRVGAQQTVSGTTRDDMTIPYSAPFEEGEYPFNTEGLVKLDLSNVEWVNYGIQEYGVEPTYKPGVRYSTNAIFDVPYEGVTFYIKINAPYELGIRSGETDTTMSTNYYWLNNKSLTSGNQNRGYIYTIPAGHEKFILSLANVTRDGSNNVTNTNHPISFMELQAAGVEIWYRPEPTPEPGYPFGTEDKVKLDLNNVEWVNYGYQPYGPEPTYHVGTRLTTNMIFDVPYEGVTFYIKINAPYELGIRSGETDTAMNTNLGWLNNKFLSSGDNNYGYFYTIPEGHKKFILTIGNVPRNSANNVSNWYKPIDLEELETAGLEIWYVPCNHSFENGICTLCGENAPSEPMTLRYDDRYDITGKTVEIVDGEGIVAVENDTLRAVGVGNAMVRIDGKLYDVTVDKTKVNIVVIMGQSNAGNHFANATSDVTCPPGTAYWWKNGATEPVDYTEPSQGFHTPLLAELYAQSAAAGDPVKNVMVWQEGVTSKNGQSIVKWAASETDTSGTDGTATMIKNCIAYYEQNSDKFEIVNCGVYWLQGESDVSMSPEKYTGLFMAMWDKLKDAGAEYVAFFRLRWGTTGNTSEHHDLGYSGSLTAQLQMISSNADMFMASTVTENWEGNETTEHSVDIRNYMTLMEEYGKDGELNDSYGNAATFADGILTTTMKTLYGSNNKCHYGKFGYGIIGADAAYNMYHALHTDEFSIVQTDTSGKAAAATISKPGESVTIDITAMTENLAFRASCGSTAGTLDIQVLSGDKDITEQVIANDVDTFGTVDTEILREYEDVTVTVTYTPAEGVPGRVIYNVVDNSPTPPEMYYWDFENDLNARDKNGEIVNSLGEALLGSYVLEDGIFKATGLHLALEKSILLREKKNWSIEWKFGEVTENSQGFIFSSRNKNEIGNKAFYHVKSGQFMISDYVDSKGYRNYTLEDVKIKTGDVIKITNKYDAQAGRSIMSLWQNGELVIEDFQQKGSMNGNTSDLDMTGYPLSGDFTLSYMGSGSFIPVTEEFDYIKIILDDKVESLSLRYDDRYDITGKTVEIVDAGTPTSFKVGYGVAEGTFDDAVITLDGDKLIATGIGTAYVRIDGTLYEVTVEAAPISLLLLAGQSNMQGIDGDPNQSVICPDGMVYATYADRYKKTVEDVTKFAPSALTGAYASINVTGDTACLENYPIHMLTESGSGREGMDSGLAYEWVRQTGEKVWVINLGYGGSSINGWLEGGEHYLACQELLSACQQTLRQEIAAGHYTLSHMGYFWCQGCADETQTAQWYAEKFQTMHQLFKTELTFDHDSDPATAEKTMEFGAIIPIRAGHSWMGSYRAGAYTHSTNVPYYQSFLDLRFNGPRVAQYWMGNNPDLPDIWNVCTIQEGWATLPDGTDGVAEYFRSAYENGTVDYPVQVRQTTSWYTPTTPADVHDNIHYNQIGYNEIGRESARNALILLGETEAPNAETTVEFMTWDGFTPADSITASTAGHSGTLVVPMVYPVWRSKEVTYSVSNGLRYDYYDLLTDNVFTSGTLTANGAVGTVSVTPKSLTNYHWIFKDSALVPSTENGQTSNPLTLLSGTITDGQFKSVRYQTAESILLLHDETWALEIQISDWTATTGSMLLSGGTNSADGQPYLYFRPADYFVGFGYYDGTQYRNHGVSLKAYGISCGTGTHTYRFVNHIAEDGTNMVWLYVDDTQIAPLTDLYLNSTLAQSENTWISGQDFVLPFLGASNIPITGMKIASIWVLETGYDSNIHIHTWSDWQTVTTPNIDGPGIDQRTCTGCSETQTREVNGVWQTHDLATYLSPLPDHLCGGLDLWDILPHNTYYYHSGTHWGIHESGSVYSVTISVTEGDRIWATSFGKYGENGNNIGTGAHGIRVTFFDIHGVCKTLTPQQTYAEFSANGYLTVPEGAIAMNIPMYSDSNDNALYILNLPHTPGDPVVENEGPHGSHDVVTCCSICGEELSREHDDGYLPGDINGDGEVDNKDITRLFQYLSDYEVEVVAEALDVNGDGSINNKDLTRLFQYLSDYEVELH